MLTGGEAESYCRSISRLIHGLDSVAAVPTPRIVEPLSLVDLK